MSTASRTRRRSSAIRQKRPNKILTFLANVEDGALVTILVGMILLAFVQIVLRNLFDIGLPWMEPLVRQMLLWVALVGAMVATRNHNHITVDAISRFLPLGRVKFACSFICDTFAMIICALLTYSTFRVFLMEYHDPTGNDIIKGLLPLWGTLLTLPLAFGIMTIRFVRYSYISLIDTIRGKIL